MLSEKAQRTGFIQAAAAYLIWGLVPVYFKQVAGISAGEILAHRIVWSVPVTIALIFFLRQPWQLGTIVRDRAVLIALLCSAFCISANWFIFTWAVTHNHILDTSLGYFINPLLTIALGVVILREKMSRIKWLALLLACIGVVYQIVVIGHLPWISLGLAISFASYGLLRKRTPVNALNGLLIETCVLFPVALFYLLFLGQQGTGSFGHSSNYWTFLLVFAGVVTTVPLALFAAGARKIPLSSLGFLQYLSPSCTFLLALLVYHEPFDHHRLLSFVLIWAGLLLLIAESIWQRRVLLQKSETG